jgi:hypothetical protein
MGIVGGLGGIVQEQSLGNGVVKDQPQSIEFLDETGRSPAQRQVQAGAPETNFLLVLGTSTNWQTLGTLTLTNSVQTWSDPAPATNFSRFYRLQGP